MRNHLMLYSKLSDELVRSMRIEPVSNLNNAVLQAIAQLGEDAEIAVIPEGPLVLPMLA